MNKNQNGFSVVEALLIFVIVGTIGGTGWYVYNSNKKTNDLLNSADNTKILNPSKSKKAEHAKEEVDVEAQSWQLTKSAQNGFRVKIPDGWEINNYGKSDNIRANKIIYKAGTKAIIDNLEYAYAGDGLTRFQIYQFKNTDNVKFLDGDETKNSFTADNVTGSKYYKKYPLEPLMGIGPIPGEETYTYEFKTSEKTTYVIYRILNKNQYSEEFLRNNHKQESSDPNQVSLIERVIKTLTIN